MDMFDSERQLVGDHAACTRSLIRVGAPDRSGINQGPLCPDPLLQLNSRLGIQGTATHRMNAEPSPIGQHPFQETAVAG